MNVVSRFVCAILAIAFGGAMSEALAADPIVGTWRLLSWSEQETQSKDVHKPFGDKPIGLITYMANKNMMLIFADPTRKPAVGPKATDAEAAQLYKTMVAYAGTYGIDGEKITHKIEVSWNRVWDGTSQQRFFVIQDNTLTIRTAPFVSPFVGKEIVATLIFERAK